MENNNKTSVLFEDFILITKNDVERSLIDRILNLAKNNTFSRQEELFKEYSTYLGEAHKKLLPKLHPYLKAVRFIPLLKAHGVFVSVDINPQTCTIEQDTLDLLDIPAEYIANVKFSQYVITSKNVQTPNLLTLIAPSIDSVKVYRDKKGCPEKKYIINLFKMCVDRTACYQGIIPNVNPNKPVKLELDYIDLFTLIYSLDRSTYYRWNAIVPEDMVPINYYSQWIGSHVIGAPCKFAGFECYRIYEQILLHYVSY